MNDIRYHIFDEPFVLESGDEIQDLKLAYHCFGKLNEEKTNIIWAFHAFSADSNVIGWWPGLFGPDCFYDPEEYYIICVNTIGSPYGSSRPLDLDFPFFTVRDIVNSQIKLAEALGISKIHTAIGGSFGGNQALEFAYSFEGEIDHLVLIACSARESAWSIALHEAQRMALSADPTFGQNNGGKCGMKAARAMAMLNYRTFEMYIQKQTDLDGRINDFSAASYVQYQGEKFVKRFNALCYYYLMNCLDTHDIGRNRRGEQEALRNIKKSSLVIGIDSDILIPTNLQKFMARYIPDAEYVEIHSEYGHDGFLIETLKLAGVIKQFYANRTIENISMSAF